ncbi:MAG: TonB family protein [Gammaproteobacteria bacterium]|nr:TonB family protein [Gammaproteobacteria bacterium]MCP5196566.1 TonB family protein [Gammaproteobacteria bacterium]
MSRFSCSGADDAGCRWMLALILALGLHAALLFGVSADRWTFRFPTPQQFQVVLLPFAERPASPELLVAAESTASEIALDNLPALAVSESASLQPESASLETSLPAPSKVVVSPTPKSVAPAPAKPISNLAPKSDLKPAPKPVPKLAPKPDLKPAPKSVSNLVPAPTSKPRAKVSPSRQKSAIAATKPKPIRAIERPATVLGRQPDLLSSSPGRLNSAALLSQVARLETDQQRQRSVDIRTKRVNLTDTRSVAGFYAADWARKVIRVGEMNFPDVARQLRLSTGPLLEVAIRADGGLREVRILRSSGNVELDRAAQRIVKLAAPYPPFSSELRQQADLLKIESPWRFDPGGRVRAR